MKDSDNAYSERELKKKPELVKSINIISEKSGLMFETVRKVLFFNYEFYVETVYKSLGDERKCI